MTSSSGDPTVPRRGSLKGILVNAGWMLGGKGVGAVLSTIYLALATRSLGVVGFSQFALALGIAQTISGLISFQSWQIVVRYGMPHLHDGDHPAIARLLRFVTLMDAGGSVVGSALAIAGFLLLGPRFGWSSEFTWQALAATVAMVISFRSTAQGLLRLYDRFATQTACETVTPVGRFAGAIVAWLVWPTPIAFLIAWSAAELATAAAYWIAALRLPGVSWQAGRAKAGTIRAENPGILRYALITNLTTSLALGAKQGAVLLVGLVVTPAAAGGFRLAQQLSQALARLSQTLARAVFPELMRSAAASRDGEEGGFHKLFARTFRMGAIGGVVVIVLLVTIGKPALTLIAGPAFTNAYPILLLLGIAAAIDFIGLGFDPALTAQGQPGRALVLRGAATLLMLAVMVPLAHRYGAPGAAAAILGASVLTFVLLGGAVRNLRPRAIPRSG